MATHRPDSALLIVGHGSTLNPDSSAPTHRQADEIRKRGVFGEVSCAFWKEEPSMREVYHMIDSPEIYIVPNFISEGYFTQEVIPRELRLDGRTTELEGKTLHYCDPVGIHPSMTKLLMKRVHEETGGEVAPAETSLIIVGHGTNLNDKSIEAIQAQVHRIREDEAFAEVVDTYMEQEPLVSDWDKHTSAKNVVVVPFFIADGLHSYQDIPVMLGIEEEPTKALSQRNDVFQSGARELRNRNLYYSRAIGTEDSLADVILDQVDLFDANYKREAAYA